jgi:MFS transporter, DHA1 family, multidrug resistance protein
VVFTVGKVLALPSVELVVSDLAPPELLGSYFGVASVAVGVGTGLGSAVGGVLAGFSALAASVGFATLAAMLALLTMRLRAHCLALGGNR